MPYRKRAHSRRENVIQANRARTGAAGRSQQQKGSTQEANTVDRTAAALLQLQRTAGNQAVTRLLQRHPSHAPNEEVQAKRLLQRHPSHADNEEVQAKRRNQTGIQRQPNEKQLSEKYGVGIGASSGFGDPFTAKMLKIVARVLQDLPLSHTKGNDMLDAIINESGGMGSASTYGYDESAPKGKKGAINMTVPDHVPTWLYPKLNQSVKWQRALMEIGAVKSYEVQPDKEITKLTGTEKDSKRKVFGGVSDVNAQGNLMEATLRHEIGHGVDQKIKFTEKLAKNGDFGGWKTHFFDGSGPISMAEGMKEYAEALLVRAGFTSEEVHKSLGYGFTLASFFISTVLDKPSVKSANNFMDNPAVKDKPDKQAPAREAIRLGLLSANVPWQLGDSSIQQITVDGRVYQRDHYQNYVSYKAAARKNAVSNYQFSSPNEWFAEAYTAYYDPKPKSPARDMLNDATQGWFNANLGPPKPADTPDQDHDPAADLRNEEGNLQEIEDNEDTVEQAVEDAVVEIAEKL